MEPINIFCLVNLSILIISIIIAHWIGIKETYNKIMESWHSSIWKVVVFCFITLVVILVIIIESWLYFYFNLGVG